VFVNRSTRVIPHSFTFLGGANGYRLGHSPCCPLPFSDIYVCDCHQRGQERTVAVPFCLLRENQRASIISSRSSTGQLFFSHRSLSQSVCQGQLPLWNLEARAVFGEILRLAVQACSVPCSWCNAGLFPGEACPTLLPQADRCALATSFPSSFPMVPSTAASSARWGKARARFCDCTHPAVGVSQTTFLPLFPEPQEHR
jgi:hypothetical protein